MKCWRTMRCPSNNVLLNLTIDLDPDGQNEVVRDRSTLNFRSLELLMSEVGGGRPEISGEPLRFNWFIRADRQIEQSFGKVDGLVRQYRAFWDRALLSGDELCWHPHLYKKANGDFVLIDNEADCLNELRYLWNEIEPCGHPFATFRCGEARMTAAMFGLVEAFGFLQESTAIPGYFSDSFGQNWLRAKNRPYFPGTDRITDEGPARRMLEMPMNSWYLRASYDAKPKLRYLNFSVHHEYFSESLSRLPESFFSEENILDIPVLTAVSHPEEIVSDKPGNDLYPRTFDNFLSNIRSFVEYFADRGKHVAFSTLGESGKFWREQCC